MNYTDIFCNKKNRFCSLIEKETDELGLACTCPIVHYLVQHDLDCLQCKALKKLKEKK